MKLTVEKERMLNGAIAYLRFKGFHEIKADIKDFQSPQMVYNENNENGCKPDLIARKDFGTYIFQVVDDIENAEDEKELERWGIFQGYSERKFGKFYLITYSEQADDLNKKIEEAGINALIIKIRK